MSRSDTTNSYPLTFAAVGETVALTEIRAGDKLRQHLGDLGLNVGMCVRIVQGGTSGPMILAVKNDSRLAVGLGMAQKIMVTKVEGDL
ncbi:MAG: ferrous iron transport protein A [Anaerolineae bacterium]|nr:ferrous iron transport protein A [Anaerolineae bacterium]